MAPPNPFPPPLPRRGPRRGRPTSKRIQDVRDYRDRFHDAMQPVPGLPPVPTGPGVPTTDPRFLEAMQILMHGFRQGGELIDAAGNYPGMKGLSPDVRDAARRAGIPTSDIGDVYGGNASTTFENAFGDLGTEFMRGVWDTDLGQGIYEDAAVNSGYIPRPPDLTATFETEQLPNPYPGMNPQPPPYYPPTNTPGGYNPDRPIGPGNMSPGAPGMPGYEPPSYPPPGLETPPGQPPLSGWPQLPYPSGHLPGGGYPPTPPINVPTVRPPTRPPPPNYFPQPVWDRGPVPPFYPASPYPPPDLGGRGIDPAIGPAWNKTLTGRSTSW